MKKEHKLFCEEYVKNGLRKVDAYYKAYPHVSNRQVASSNAYRLMLREDVKKYISKLIGDCYTDTVMDTIEILEELSEIARDRKAYNKDRIAALDLLGKYHKLYTDKVEVEGTVETININIEPASKPREEEKE